MSERGDRLLISAFFAEDAVSARSGLVK